MFITRNLSKHINKSLFSWITFLLHKKLQVYGNAVKFNLQTKITHYAQ